MIQEQLQNFGLTKAQSAVLGYLLENKEAKASLIARSTSHPRGVVYKVLEELLAMELVEKQEKEGQIARFRASHPQNIEKVLEEKEKKLEQSKKAWADLLPQLVSSYNMTLNKPGIKFFEGEDGFKKVLYDTLTSKSEVYLFINTEAMEEEEKFKEINAEYKQKRINGKIVKKILRVGKKPELTFGTSNEKYDAMTEIRYAEELSSISKAAIHIYDNKISYQIIDGEKIIGILIEDKNIYEMNKAWFEMMWETAKS
ncbi:MAG: helix-turn-helix domain-containing protein [Parcubacteria group bacterium]|jgi:sugar-specific transcriptional regulator TrmB